MKTKIFLFVLAVLMCITLNSASWSMVAALGLLMFSAPVGTAIKNALDRIGEQV